MLTCYEDFFIGTLHFIRSREEEFVEIGKIPPEILEKIVLKPIGENPMKREDVLLRPTTGEDCTAVSLGGETCILSTDPITGATKDMGYICVHINCNDIASSGGEPIGILLTILLPPEGTEKMLEEIMDGARKAAGEIGIEILGGHTEVTDAVNRPVVSGAVVGKTKDRRLVTTGGAKVGQDVVMTKWAGLEGTTIIAHDFEEELKKSLAGNVVDTAKKMSGFLSVVKEAKISMDFEATAMHDATEGGVLGALWEIAECSDTGIWVDLEKIPVKEETKLICHEAKIDVYGLISSGTLLITTFRGSDLVKQLTASGIQAEVVGKITKKNKIIYEKGQERRLNQPKSDAIYGIKFNK